MVEMSAGYVILEGGTGHAQRVRHRLGIRGQEADPPPADLHRRRVLETDGRTRHRRPPQPRQARPLRQHTRRNHRHRPGGDPANTRITGRGQPDRESANPSAYPRSQLRSWEPALRAYRIPVLSLLHAGKPCESMNLGDLTRVVFACCLACHRTIPAGWGAFVCLGALGRSNAAYGGDMPWHPWRCLVVTLFLDLLLSCVCGR